MHKILQKIVNFVKLFIYILQQQINIILKQKIQPVYMDRKQYTPTKTLKQTNVNSIAQSQNRPQYSRGSELNLLKDYETIKIQVRQLEAQNRNLNSQIQRLNHQRIYNQNKYLQKLSHEQETLNQFQKQKNYQLELLQLKHQEQINKVKRECQHQVDDLLRQIKNKDYQIREKNQQTDYLQLKNNQLNKQLTALEKQLIKSRDSNSEMNELLNKQQFANKKLQMLVDELQRHKEQMQGQIHVLLQIQTQKSKNINYLEAQLRISENNEKNLNEKLTLLTENFNALEDHIAVMKEKLLNADAQNRELEGILNRTEMLLKEKQSLLIQSSNRENNLTRDLQEQLIRQRKRQQQIAQLVTENERLYSELNCTKQRLYDVCVNFGIQI